MKKNSVLKMYVIRIICSEQNDKYFHHFATLYNSFSIIDIEF